MNKEEKKLNLNEAKKVVGGSVYPSRDIDGNYCLQCPSCNTIIKGNTQDECWEKYQTHSKACYVNVL